MKRLPAAVAAIALAAACSRDAPARRQWVVVVDTDALAVEDLGPEVSRIAVVDTVRIDILDANDRVRVLREFSTTSRADWPLSFGLAPDETGDVPIVRLRLRAFRARDAEATVEDGVSTLAPEPGLAIDRVVTLGAPADGVSRVLVMLGLDCLGQPASFGARTTCVDGRPSPFDVALPPAPDGLVSRVGTSPLARDTPCEGASIPGRICIPGGLDVIGSSLLAGYEDDFNSISPLPSRLVRVGSFWMDETEMTVGRARRWLPTLASPPPYRVGAKEIIQSRYCTMSDDPASDALPLNCVLEATAKEICEREGGALPTEAEWSHAATGRGEGRRYPWGESTEGCCNASIGRTSERMALAAECAGEGPEPVASHRAVGVCKGRGDVSRDGVFDLAGGVTEILADRSRRLDDDCWGARFGILVDPVCKGGENEPVGTRGGSWASGLVYASVGFRLRSALGPDRGFRCVYRSARP